MGLQAPSKRNRAWSDQRDRRNTVGISVPTAALYSKDGYGDGDGDEWR